MREYNIYSSTKHDCVLKYVCIFIMLLSVKHFIPQICVFTTETIQNFVASMVCIVLETLKVTIALKRLHLFLVVILFTAEFV